MSNLFWPDEKAARLKVLWDNGFSARLCADELGVSRNAVMGKVRRMGLEARRVVQVHRGSHPKRQKRRLHTPHQRDVFGKLLAPVAFVPREADVKPRHLKWEDITPGDGLCRESYGKAAPFTYCGHPVQPKSSYCTFHHAINYTPWRPVIDREQFHQTRRENFRAYKAELVEA